MKTQYFGTPIEIFEQVILDLGIQSTCEYFGIPYDKELEDDLIKKYRAASTESQSAIPQQPQGEICSSNICAYCEGWERRGVIRMATQNFDEFFEEVKDCKNISTYERCLRTWGAAIRFAEAQAESTNKQSTPCPRCESKSIFKTTLSNKCNCCGFVW